VHKFYGFYLLPKKQTMVSEQVQEVFFLYRLNMVATSSTSLTNPQISQFNGKNYDYWAITMKTLFSSQDIWDLVENGFPELAYATRYNALSQVERYLLRDNKKKDSKSLFYIFQVVHGSSFPRIAATTKSKQAWDIHQTSYQGMTKSEENKATNAKERS